MAENDGMKKLFVLSLGLVLLGGCSHSVSRDLAGQAQPSSRALETKKITEVKSQPYFQFSWAKRSFRVAHGQWKIKEENPGWNKMYGWGPVVWVTEGKRSRVLDLRQDFPSKYVAHVFQSESNGWIYLFLEHGIAGPESQYHVWMSKDQGETWLEGAKLQRPPEGSFPPASLTDFFLDEKGQGAAWFKLEASSLAPPERKGLPLWAEAYYRARTRDGGLTWEYDKEPQFSSVLQPEMEKHHGAQK